MFAPLGHRHGRGAGSAAQIAARNSRGDRDGPFATDKRAVPKL
jgi:hypothetical protein